MARSYVGLVNMATRFGFRLAKAREGSQHLGRSVRYLLEDKNGVLPFRSLEDVERKLSAMAQSVRLLATHRDSMAVTSVRIVVP